MASSPRTADPPYANAPRRKVRPAEPLAFTVDHSTDRRGKLTTDRRMSLRNEQEPFSLSELAAGITAVSALLLVALLVVIGSLAPNPPAANTAHAAPCPPAV